MDGKVILFCYGTLKQGDIRHVALSKARFIGKARTSADFTLFSCGSFPAMVEATTDETHTGVIGELYEVDESLLDNRLDIIEGRPFLYDRAIVPIQSVETDRNVLDELWCEDVTITKAVTYIYQQSVTNLRHLGETWKVNCDG